MQSGLEKVGGTCWGQQIVQRVLDTSWGLQQWVVSSHHIFTPLSSKQLKQPQQPGIKSHRCFRKISAVSSQSRTSPASSLLPTNTFRRASCPPPRAVRGREKMNTLLRLPFYTSLLFSYCLDSSEGFPSDQSRGRNIQDADSRDVVMVTEGGALVFGNSQAGN